MVVFHNDEKPRLENPEDGKVPEIAPLSTAEVREGRRVSFGSKKESCETGCWVRRLFPAQV